MNQALDNQALTFTTGGTAQWYPQTATAYFGDSAAQSGGLGNNQSEWLQTTVVGPGNISFYWKVSSEATYDFLEVSVDDVVQSGSISGEVDWQRRTVAIPAGSHQVRWIYSKDASATGGEDSGWVDKVYFVQNAKVALPQVLNVLLMQ